MPITTRKNIVVCDLPRFPKPGTYMGESGVALAMVVKKNVNAVLTYADDAQQTVKLDDVHTWDVTEPTLDEKLEEQAQAVVTYMLHRYSNRDAVAEELRETVASMQGDVAGNNLRAISSFSVEQLIARQARLLIVAYIDQVTHNEKYTSLETYREKVKYLRWIVMDKVSGWWGARSTSAVSNIMEQVEHDMWVSILRDLKDQEN